MKYKKFIVLIIIMLLIFNLIACSKQKEEEVTPYLKYIITTYSSGVKMEVLEVYSNMEVSANKSSITIYDSQGNSLFYTNLEYKINRVIEQ